MGEFDEFGIPKRNVSNAPVAKTDGEKSNPLSSTFDEFGIPLKKKEPTTSSSLSGQSTLAFTPNTNLVDNSFLKNIGENAAQSYTTPRGIVSPDESLNFLENKNQPLDFTLTPKPEKKDYYNAPQFKLEKGLIFDKKGQLYAPSSEVLTTEIPRLKEEDISLKKSTQKDLVEKAREMPIETPTVEEPAPEGEWGFDKILNDKGLDANLVQNVAANFELAGTKLAKAAALGIRDLSSGLSYITGQGTNPELFENGKPTKYAESATWLNDPLGKVALGLMGNEKRMQNVIRNNQLPNNFIGNTASAVASMAPDFAAVALMAPEVAAVKGAGLIKTIGSTLINNFTKYLTVKGALEGYGEARTEGKNAGEAALESGKGALSGFGNGVEMAAFGAGSNWATKRIMSKAEQMGLRATTANAARKLTNYSTDVIAYGLMSPLLHSAFGGEWPDAKQIAEGIGVASLFRIKGEIENAKTNAELNTKLSEALKQTQELKQFVAIGNFVDADLPAIKQVYYTKESADELQLQALDFAKKARETSDLQKKAEYIAKTITYAKAANVRQVTDHILDNPNDLQNFEQSDLPEDTKQEFLQKAEEVRRMLDPIEQQKTAFGEDVKNTKEFIQKLTEALKTETDPVKSAELEERIRLANIDLEESNNKLKSLIREQFKPVAEEDLTNNEGIQNAKNEFNKKIDEQISALDKNNPDYENDLEALNRKKEAYNEHYDSLLSTKTGVEQPTEEVKPTEIKEEPLKENEYYHATDATEIIAPSEKGYKKREGPNVVGEGIYFGKDKEHLTDRYGKNTIKVELDIKNPLISDNKYIIVDGREIDVQSLSKEDIKFLKEKGYDAVQYKSPDKAYSKYDETIIFDKSQIKSQKLLTEEVKPTEVKVEEPKVPVAIPEEVHNPIINKIRKGIEKLSKTAKVSVLKGKNFAKALDEAIKTGKVNLQSWGGFEKKGFEETPEWKKLIDNGTVKLNFDIKGLEGKPVVVINPDNMLTGDIITKDGKTIVNGNGGINFVTKFGDVWASSANDTASTLANYINEARNKDIAAGGDGTVHIIVSKGDLQKSLSSHTGSKAAMSVLEHMVDTKLISLADFRKALTDVGRKYGIDFNGKLDAKSIHKDIADKFFGVKDSTFEQRGYFVQDIIDHLAENSQSVKDNIKKIREELNTNELPKSVEERKTGRISFSKEGIMDAIGHLLSDSMTVGVKNSQAYATIEIKHPVKVVDLSGKEGGHESYPFHLQQFDENGNKVKPILNVLNNPQHITDILNDANNKNVPRSIRTGKLDSKGKEIIESGAGKLGSNQIGMAKGYVKPAAEHPTGVNMMTDATGKIYGFEQNGKIVLNADLMNGNTPFHEAGHLWLSWAKENRSDLHDAGMEKIENSTYLKDVKNNKIYQDNASKLPEGEREAYFKSEALAKAIGDNGEKFVTEAQKSDFKKWVKELWETIATHFGLRDMTAEQISNMTLDDFSKKVVADIVGKETEKGAKLEVETEEAPKEKPEVEFSIEEVYNKLPKGKNLRESAQKTLISSNFDKIIDELIKSDKIQKKC
jgi:hypothetical protein